MDIPVTRAQAVEAAWLKQREDDYQRACDLAVLPIDKYSFWCGYGDSTDRPLRSLPPEAAAPVATPTCYRGTVGCHFGQEYGVGCCPGKAPHSITCDRLMDARVGHVPPPREGG